MVVVQNQLFNTCMGMNLGAEDFGAVVGGEDQRVVFQVCGSSPCGGLLGRRTPERGGIAPMPLPRGYATRKWGRLS